MRVIERGTEAFGPTETAPDDAYDMDVDPAPGERQHHQVANC